MGSADGRVKYYVNHGTATNFEFRLANSDIFYQSTKKYYGAAGRSRGSSTLLTSTLAAVAVTATSAALALPVSSLSILPGVEAGKKTERTLVGTFTAPFCYDIDEDGDLDCLVVSPTK